MGGPAWLGIGAQRSGTTWLTGLLTQHPQVDLAVSGRKELRLLHKVADGLSPAADYRELFPADGVLRGEWTPQYMRHASVPCAAVRHAPDALVLASLRDPVERFASAMRLAAGGRQTWAFPVPITVHAWSGFYADQLDLWSHFVGAERMHVLVYEQVREDPQRAVDGIWRKLGLDPVPLTDVTRESSSSSKGEWDWPDGLRESLILLYRPQAERLERDWGLDVSSWKSLR